MRRGASRSRADGLHPKHAPWQHFEVRFGSDHRANCQNCPRRLSRSASCRSRCASAPVQRPASNGPRKPEARPRG
eukprot:5435138-Pleurochrysis_carterae.AAC.2